MVVDKTISITRFVERITIMISEQRHNNPYQRQLYDRLHLQDFKQIETVSSSLNKMDDLEWQRLEQASSEAVSRLSLKIRIYETWKFAKWKLLMKQFWKGLGKGFIRISMCQLLNVSATYKNSLFRHRENRKISSKR